MEPIRERDSKGPADTALDQKEVMSAAELGQPVELTPEEAEALGAFRESALSLDDVLEADDG